MVKEKRTTTSAKLSNVATKTATPSALLSTISISLDVKNPPLAVAGDGRFIHPGVELVGHLCGAGCVPQFVYPQALTRYHTDWLIFLVAIRVDAVNLRVGNFLARHIRSAEENE